MAGNKVTVRRKKEMSALKPECSPYANVTEELALREEKALALLREDLVSEGYSNVQQMVSQELFAPLEHFAYRDTKLARNAEDMQNIFDTFRKILREVNKVCAYTPTLCTFLQFANISNLTFNAYLEMKDELGDVTNSIKNFLSEQTIQGVWGGTTKEISGIFAMKSMYGFRENEQPQTNIININSQERSVEDILSEFNKISKR